MNYRLPNVKNKYLRDPHVVIVGAGASIAACKYDKNNVEIPVLKNIHHILGLTDKLNKYNFSESQMENFEELFSFIYGKEEYRELEIYLENAVREYFEKLEIPDEPTIYDYLLLSLTSKDAIISFNWDPFLVQAFQRNVGVGNLPEIIFPHGNVGIGLCNNCHVKGFIGDKCMNCHNDFDEMQLLFPIGKKDYSIPIIKK